MKWEFLADKDVRKVLRTAYRPCSETSRSAQRTKMWSGGCSNELYIQKLLEYAYKK